MLMQCIDSLVQKVQSGVVINFEKIGPDPPPIEGANKGEGEGDEANHEGEQKEVEGASGDGERNGVSTYVIRYVCPRRLWQNITF